MCPGAERPKLIWAEGRERFPLVIAREIDVFPAEWRQMGQITGRWIVPLVAQMIDSTLQVGRVP
jgi:hypothetical protein